MREKRKASKLDTLQTGAKRFCFYRQPQQQEPLSMLAKVAETLADNEHGLNKILAAKVLIALADYVCEEFQLIQKNKVRRVMEYDLCWFAKQFIPQQSWVQQRLNQASGYKVLGKYNLNKGEFSYQLQGEDVKQQLTTVLENFNAELSTFLTKGAVELLTVELIKHLQEKLPSFYKKSLNGLLNLQLQQLSI